jgi:hypothetical protein
MFAMFAFGDVTRTAQANVEQLTIVEATFENTDTYCDETNAFGGVQIVADTYNYNTAGDPYLLEVGDTLAICVFVDSNEPGDVVSADSDDYGRFVEAICNNEDEDNDDFEVNDDQCSGLVGLNNDDVEIACGDQINDGEGDDENLSECSDPEEEEVPVPAEEGDDDGDILLFWECEAEAGLTEITISQTDGLGDGTTVFSLWVFCAAQPDTIEVTASPTKVEIIPQIGSSAHSEITIELSADGLPTWWDDVEIDVSVPKCAIEFGNDDPDSSPLSENWPADDSSDDTLNFDTNSAFTKTIIDDIWFHADWNKCTPGDVVVTVHVEVDDGADLVDTVTINVVGPPAFITATAAPDKLICGEKSTITVKVTDAIGQNVSDNTKVELISNWGSVIAGTGATLGFPGTGPVNPLASSAAATYNGVAVAYLLTSNTQVGAYEVVAAAGGTIGLYPYTDPYEAGHYDPYYGSYYNEDDDPDYYEEHIAYSSYYAGAPITTQVTVTCSLPAAPVAPTVAAPSTGTGSITPPNTGDAGLAGSSSNGMLFVVIGAVAFVLAGVASVSYARK